MSVCLGRRRGVPKSLASRTLLLCATLLSSACTDARTSASTIAVVDSAGVRVVTNVPGSIEAAETWSLSAEPVVDIGSGASPDVPLFRVTAVVPVARGRVVAGTNTPPQALLFEADGTLVATLGREGDGPGELASVASVVPLGSDSLAVWDDVRRRMSVFTADGHYVRDVDLSALAMVTPLAAPSMSMPSAWTLLLPSRAGSLVLFQVGVMGPGPGVRRVAAPSYRIAADGEQLATFGPFPGQELFDFGAGQGGAYSYPFGADTHGITSGDMLVVGTAEAPELRFYSSDGTLQRIVRWPDHDRTVGGALLADWNRVSDDWLARMPADQRAYIADLLERMPQRERFPAYDGVVASDRGEVWVGEYAGQLTMPYPPLDVRVPPRQWLVFDADGALAARVRTPEGFQPLAAREGRVWGVFTDELDVESIRAYEIVSPAAMPGDPG